MFCTLILKNNIGFIYYEFDKSFLKEVAIIESILYVVGPIPWLFHFPLEKGRDLIQASLQPVKFQPTTHKISNIPILS